MISKPENLISKVPVTAKLLALVEVLLVTMAGIPFTLLGLYALFPAFETWQTERLGFPFAVFGDVVMVLAAISMILLRREKFREYGLTLHGGRQQLNIFAACFFPVFAAGIPLGMGVDYKSWPGALIIAGVQVGLLFFLGWTLRGKPNPGAAAVLGAGVIIIPAATLRSPPLDALIQFMTYAVFVGFGEEIFYRGYVQTRLNGVFGKPLRFFGVPVGWGLLLASLVFGMTHLRLISFFLGDVEQINWAWGFWTVFGGLVFGFVREKSGGILASALLHGLPQAVVMAVMAFLQQT